MISIWKRVGTGRQSKWGVEVIETPHKCCVVFGNGKNNQLDRSVCFFAGGKKKKNNWSSTIWSLNAQERTLQFLPIIDKNTLNEHLQEPITHTFNRYISVCLCFYIKNVKYMTFLWFSSQYFYLNFLKIILKHFLQKSK